MVQCCFTSTETIRLNRTGNQGRPPRLSHMHSSRTLFARSMDLYLLDIGPWLGLFPRGDHQRPRPIACTARVPRLSSAERVNFNLYRTSTTHDARQPAARESLLLCSRPQVWGRSGGSEAQPRKGVSLQSTLLATVSDQQPESSCK